MKKDIATLLNELQRQVELVENGDQSEALLDQLCGGFLELLELIKLFLISERDSYYGYFLMNMRFQVNVQCHCIAGIRLREFPPVFESNPLLLCKFSLREILYIVCHEIDHVVLNHPAEMIKATPEGDEDACYRFNLAADASVNDRIDHEIAAESRLFLAAPKGAVTSRALSQMFHLKKLQPMESYAYYFRLLLNKKDFHPDTEPPHSGAPQNGQEAILSVKGEQNGTSNRIVTARNCGRLSDHGWEAGNDADEASAAVKELVNRSVSMMGSESRGRMPGYFLSQVELLNQPPSLTWQAILKKYVGTITANQRKTRTRLNRRQPERFDLSGSIDDKVLKLVVAIDTSGSVDNRMIAQIFQEIFCILSKRRHDITVIECDAEVQRVYRARTAADIRRKVSGRGGTCFSPVIEYLNQNRYFRDALLIYFTDGYGEGHIPRPRTYRNIWVILGRSSQLSVSEPYGVVLEL